MTDHSSDYPRRRRRSGRHQQPARRRASPPLSPDEARRNRESAFGTTSEKRTWLAGAAASPPTSSSPAEATDPSPTPSGSTTPTADMAASHDADPAAAAPDASPAAAAPTAADGASTGTPRSPEAEPPDRRARGRRAAFPLEQLAHTPDAAASSPAAPEESSARGRRRAALPAETTAEQDVWASASPPSPVGRESASDRAPAAMHEPTADREPAAERVPVAARATGSSAEGRTVTRAEEPEEASDSSGSLPKVAFWTVLTSLIPGSGLLTTRMRRFGWLLLVVLLLALVAAGAFLLFGDPLRTGVILGTKRGVLIGAMIAVGVVGLVWALQIVLANLAHSTRERLAGAKRFLALGLAALMVVAVLVPATRGVQSLWALQGLMGSRTVFGGGEGGDHPFTTGEDPWAGAERLNIMLLGQDAGADRTGTRPDTIMVASIDPESGRTALFSIPRNLEKVQFPEGTPPAEVFPNGFDYFGPDQSLINAVWTWAEDRPDLFPNDPEPGLTVTRWAVEETLGLQMDYYAMVNLQGFEDLVDALGGVDMVVERRIPIGGGASKIDGYIEPGLQKLDGFHALWYARSREGSNDFNRMCRQQRIVRAVTEEADPTTLALSIPGLVNATEENIQTDIPVKNLDAFVDLALRIKDAGFTSYPITQDVTFSGNPDYEYLEKWVQASIEDSMQQEAPESVLGETEPGSTEPAETGAAPEQESEGADGSSAPEESASEEETSTEEESTATDGSGEETSDPAPTIEQDPLKSCLPGAQE